MSAAAGGISSSAVSIPQLCYHGEIEWLTYMVNLLQCYYLFYNIGGVCCYYYYYYYYYYLFVKDRVNN